MAKDFPLGQAGFNPFGDLLGLQFTEVGGGASKCALEVRDDLLNPHGVLHGGIIYSMADTGMGAAVYSALDGGELCTTVEIKIMYLEAVRGGELTCATRLARRTRSIAVLESEVTDGAGAKVALATGTFYIYGREHG